MEFQSTQGDTAKQKKDNDCCWPLTVADIKEGAEQAADAFSKWRQATLAPVQMYMEMVPALGARLERAGREMLSEPPKQKHDVDWLVVMDLTTRSYGSQTGDNNERRLRHLETIAKESKGKPVAIVVQMPYLDVSDGDYDGELLDKYSSVVPHPHHIDRYIVYDGKVTKLDTVNSGGYAYDLTKLVSLAGTMFNGDRTALFMDSHGMGGKGLSGDTGDVTMKEFVEALKTGLKKANGNQQKDRDNTPLDLMDFDACFMGNHEVMRLLRPLTNHVVASAHTEGGRGQNFVAPLRSILNNSRITPAKIAEIMVETARNQPVCRDLTKHQPSGKKEDLWMYLDTKNEQKESGAEADDKCEKTPSIATLAHYDLRHITEFQKELDQFGDALCAVVGDPKNRRTIDKLIADITVYGKDGWYVPDKRDVKTFVESVLDAVNKKELPDPDQFIRIHGGRLLDSHKKLVRSYSGFDNYISYGGLSTFLPDRQGLDFHPVAVDRISASQFRQSAEEPPDLSVAATKKKYVEDLDWQMARMDRQINAAAENTDQKILETARHKWKTLGESLAKLKVASQLSDTLQALSAMRKAAKELEETEFFQSMTMEEEKELKDDIDKEYKAELVNASGGWGKFRLALRRLD